MPFDRREFLTGSGLAVAAAAGVGSAATACSGPSRPSPPGGKPDYTVHIGTGLVELAPDRVVSTTTYNGQFPGPLLRFKEGHTTWVDIYNDTDTPEQLHWHGQIDTASTSTAPPRKAPPTSPPTACAASRLCPARRASASITPTSFARADLVRGQYSGQVGPVYIEPKQNPGGLRPGSLPHAQGI